MDQGTKTRKIIYDAIVSYIEEHGYCPSVRELCDITGLRSTATIQHHLYVMFEMGILETDSESGTPRAIRVPGYKFVKVEVK